jgi:hypothetical protein
VFAVWSARGYITSREEYDFVQDLRKYCEFDADILDSQVIPVRLLYATSVPAHKTLRVRIELQGYKEFYIPLHQGVSRVVLPRVEEVICCSERNHGECFVLVYTGKNIFVFVPRFTRPEKQGILWEDSVVSIATGYWLGDRGVGSSSSGRIKNFLFSTSFRPALGPTQPPIQWVWGALSPGVKRQRREADHSHLTSAEVKKMWIYTSTNHMP